jgi:HD-like signal output (HDOD) protein
MRLPVDTIYGRLITAGGVSFPRTIEKIDRLSADPRAPTGVITAVIGSDPMLSALTISRANAISSTDLTQVSSSVMLLGMASVRGLLRDVEPIPEVSRKIMASCWSLANAAATMTRLLAGHCGKIKQIGADDETLYVMGLLHDLGTVAAILHFPQEYEESIDLLQKGAGSGVRRPAPQDGEQAAELPPQRTTESGFSEIFAATLGVEPSVLGYLLGRLWNLPPLFLACIRFHEQPEKAGEFADLAALVHLARNLVRACGFCAGGDIYLDPISDNALSGLGLYPEDLKKVITEFYDEMAELELYEGALVG